MLRWSQTKCQRVVSGAVATTACTCARKSSDLRVGPAYGATTFPVTTSRLTMKARVPWRMYSNSRRSTLEGGQGQSWVLALQGLDPGQFICAHRPFSLFGQIGSLSIDLTDRPNGFFLLWISR